MVIVNTLYQLLCFFFNFFNKTIYIISILIVIVNNNAEYHDIEIKSFCILNKKH